MQRAFLGALAIAAVLSITAAPALAADRNALAVDIAPAAGNPARPQMGDRLSFETHIRNKGATAVEGIIAWLSLVRVDPGHEHPVSLEDWSAEKAVTVDRLAPGAEIATDWPMRLIEDGHYRVVVSAASAAGDRLAVSPFADLDVRRKPVVESRRVLPVAIGMPLLPLLLPLLFWGRR